MKILTTIMVVFLTITFYVPTVVLGEQPKDWFDISLDLTQKIIEAKDKELAIERERCKRGKNAFTFAFFSNNHDDMIAILGDYGNCPCWYSGVKHFRMITKLTKATKSTKSAEMTINNEGKRVITSWLTLALGEAKGRIREQEKILANERKKCRDNLNISLHACRERNFDRAIQALENSSNCPWWDFGFKLIDGFIEEG